MLGLKKIPKGIEKYSYATTRAFLLLYSTGFKLLIKNFRQKHKLADKSSNTVLKWLITANAFADKPQDCVEQLSKESIKKISSLTLTDKSLDVDAYYQLCKEINKLCVWLNLPQRFIHACIANPPMQKDLLDYLGVALPVYFAPIKEDGFYIKVDNYTKLSDIKLSYKFIKENLRAFAESADYVPKNIRIVEKDYKLKIDNLYIYIFIEKDILSIIETDSEKPNRKNLGKWIVNEAIRFTKEELKERNDFDISEETLKKRYFDLLKNYQIPKLDDFLNYK